VLLQAQRERRLNLIFILTDDQRFDAIGASGNRRIRTPNLDKLAARSVRFTNAFVSTAVCSASRAACLTGRYGSVNGVPGLGGGLKTGETTFVESLKRAGYQTGFVGKWHLNNPATPSAGAFDYDVHFIANGPHTDRKVIEHGKNTVAKGFIEDYLADRAAEFIDKSAGKPQPFFLHLCNQLPHMDDRNGWDPRPDTLAAYEKVEMRPPANWKDTLENKPEYLKTARFRERAMQFGYDRPGPLADHVRRYYGSITDLDRSLGRLFSLLDARKLWENTAVVFMSDNGWFLGEHLFSSKVLPYEESIRVPFLVAAPGIAPRVEDRLVMNADIAPTLLGFGGASPGGRIHGRSLVPLLARKPVEWRSGIFYEARVPTLGSWPLVAVRDRRWKYIRTYDVNQPGRLIFEELYDLETDPGEMTNLAGAHPEQKRMQSMLAKCEKEYWV
jgi:arylsulfatase A-like enzyme